MSSDLSNEGGSEVSEYREFTVLETVAMTFVYRVSARSDDEAFDKVRQMGTCDASEGVADWEGAVYVVAAEGEEF